MKIKNISSFVVIGLILLLGITACSSASAGTIEPVVRDFRPIQVEAVQVEIGVGSPIPVDIFISGSWPDLCAQLAQVNQAINGNRITVDILASPASENCPLDQLGLPFRIALPWRRRTISAPEPGTVWALFFSSAGQPIVAQGNPFV